MARSHAHAASFRAALRLFAIFGEPTRVVVFQRLARQPMTAGQLTKGLTVTRPAIVQHLKILEAAGLVAARQDGRRRVYRTDPAGLAPLSAWLDRHSRLPPN